jgi:hypothetical protein
MATKFKIIEDAKRQARLCFLGIAIPCDKTTADGSTIRSEKVLKFNRKALKNVGKNNGDKVDSRLVGGDDTMRFPVSKPGSKERVEALILQYASLADDEMSPFTFE